MTKVAHVVSSLHIGGAERFVIDLCHVQKNLNITPSVISMGDPQEPLVNECKKLNIPVIVYGNNPIIKLIRLLFVLSHFDVIHIHSQHALKFLSHILPLFKNKVIYTRHGAAPLSTPSWLSFHQKAHHFVDIVTFVSQEGLDVFQQNHGWNDVPSYVIDNGVLLLPVDKNNPENKIQLRIGSVGRMVPLKNQIGLLRAISFLNEEEQNKIAIHFFGDGECGEELKAFTAQNLSDVDVTFHGMVNDRELIYSNLDVLVVTSETEGLSMVIIEAMANKIPVIASDVGGNPKLVINGQTGWLFNYNDDTKLSEYIQSCLNNRQLVIECGNNAFDYICCNFSIESAAKQYAQLYNA